MIGKGRYVLGEIWSTTLDLRKRKTAAGILQFMNLETEIRKFRDWQEESEFSYSVATLQGMSR